MKLKKRLFAALLMVAMLCSGCSAGDAGLSEPKAVTALPLAEQGDTFSIGFADVPSGAWYAEAAEWCRANGVVSGTTATTFSPNETMTHAMLLTILYCAAGSPAVSGAEDSWYGSAVAWSAERGLTGDYDNGRLDPSVPVTREQIAAILYRYATYKGYDTENAGSIANFSDAAKVSSWANTAISWAVGEGLMNGDNGALRPQGNATRAEIAALLMRFAENIAK